MPFTNKKSLTVTTVNAQDEACDCPRYWNCCAYADELQGSSTMGPTFRQGKVNIYVLLVIIFYKHVYGPS